MFYSRRNIWNLNSCCCCCYSLMYFVSYTLPSFCVLHECILQKNFCFVFLLFLSLSLFHSFFFFICLPSDTNDCIAISFFTPFIRYLFRLSTVYCDLIIHISYFSFALSLLVRLWKKISPCQHSLFSFVVLTTITICILFCLFLPSLNCAILSIFSKYILNVWILSCARWQSEC